MNEINHLTSIEELVTFVPVKFKRALKIVHRSNAIAKKRKNDIPYKNVQDLITATESIFLSCPGAGKVALENFLELKSFIRRSLGPNQDITLFDYHSEEISLEERPEQKLILKEEHKSIDLFSLDMSQSDYILLKKNNINNLVELYDFELNSSIPSYQIEKFLKLKTEIPSLIEKYILFRDSIDPQFHRIELSELKIPKNTKASLEKACIVYVSDLFHYPKFVRELSYIDKENIYGLVSNIGEILTAHENHNFFTNEGELNFEKLEMFLIESFEGLLLEETNESHRDVILSYFGFLSPRLKVVEIASKHLITRRVVDYIVRKFAYKFKQAISPNISRIRNYIKDKSINLMSKFNTLRGYFDETGFYLFVEKFLDLHKSNLCVNNMADYNIFVKLLFTEKYYALSKEKFIEELMLEFDLNLEHASNITNNLIKEGSLQERNSQLLPKDLGKHHAIANLLLEHKSGLPWKDITNIINSNNTSKAKLRKNFKDNAFYDSNLIYLSAHGTYRHTVFLEFDINADLVFSELYNHVSLKEDKCMLLMDFVHNKNYNNFNYFDLRYFIKMNCEKYKLKFNGKSGVDMIFLGDFSVSKSQKDLLLNYIIRQDIGCTKEDLTKQLRSQSPNHASLLVYELISERKIVKIDENLYLSPEKAFKGINTDSILKCIDEALGEKIYEISYFKNLFNQDYGFYYSKSFYLSLVNFYKDKYGWFLNRSLLSKYQIKYQSLQAVIRDNYKKGSSISENVINLQNIVCIPRDTATSAIHNYLAGKES